MRFLKTTLLGGIMFVLPLVLIGVLVAKLLQVTVRMLEPIESLLPHWTIAGAAAPHLTAAAIVLMLCFVAGLFASTPPGQRLRSRLEQNTLGKIPGYAMVRTLFAGAVPTEKSVDVALVEMENMLVIAFVMERHADGGFTLFVPSAPTPAVGSLYLARGDQVRIIDAKLKDAMMCISRLGIGAEKLLAGGEVTRDL